MDKYEFKHLLDQIMGLIEEGQYAEAASIADTIDWRRVKNIITLGQISDLYKINCRYEDARDIMLLAYERKPESRQVCYSLCELYCKTGEPVEAAEFYKEFEKLAPKDPGRYILKYKVYDAFGASIDEKIEVLEKLKEEDYQEKWMYELANLYHRRGLGTKCVEICDELILWFGEGKYVNMAMELKMLHEPLTPSQQQKYDNRFRSTTAEDDGSTYAEEPDDVQEAPAQDPGDTQIFERGMHMEPASEEPVSGQEYEPTQELQVELPSSSDDSEGDAAENTENVGDTRMFDVEEVRRQLKEQAPAPEEEMDIQVKTVDVGRYNTMNLQAEIAKGLQEILENDAPASAEEPEQPREQALEQPAEQLSEQYPLQPEYLEAQEYSAEPGDFAEPEMDDINRQVMAEMREDSMNSLVKQAMTAQPPEPMAQVLVQESDGQIGLVVPESKHLEKQITGQMSIEDIRAEWERMKQESKAKQEEEVRQQVLRHTGKMFTEFEEKIRDSILKKMEDPEYNFPDPVPEESEDLGEAVTDWDMEGIAENVIDSDEDTAGEFANVIADQPEPEAEAEPEVEATEPETEAIEPEAEAEPETEAEEAETKEEPEVEAAEDAETKEKPEVEAEQEVEATEPDAETKEESEAEAEQEVEAAEPEEETKEEPEAEAGEAETAETPEQKPVTLEEELDEEGDFVWGEEPVEMESEEQSVPENDRVVDDGKIDYERLPEEEEEVSREDEGETSTDTEPVTEEGYDEEPEESTEEAGSDESGQPEALRALTKEEEEIYGSLVQGNKAREQLVRAIDAISMAPFTGNVVISGETGMNTLELAKKMIYEVKTSDSNFSGKVAKIPAASMNNKDVTQLLNSLKNGALIIEKASALSDQSAQDLYKNLQRENFGIIIVLLDTKKGINGFFKRYENLKPMFNARMHMKPLSNEALAYYARQYAKDNEFAIDDMGLLALHTRIDELQTANHAANYEDVQAIMDDAIYSASRLSLGHFFDILFGRRYDEEDMIYITEKDFR